jgi:NAD(P)-dependent dehydrogenase (short-subunit alcohol dehydrogenase family)
MTTKIAMVTGGSRGLGKEMALRLAASGRDVVITYLKEKEKAEEVVADIETMGRKAAALRLDVGNWIQLEDYIQTFQSSLKEVFGTDKFDFLVNNAGIGETIPFLEATEEDFDRFMNIHFKGVFFLTQKLVPLMNDGGRIINISTGTTRFAFPGYSIYASMKGAIETFTKYLSKELGERKIAANVLAPGGIKTDFNNAAIRNNPQIEQYIASQTALGRVGESEDIGGIVAFLCSDDAYWINAQRIEASGGMFL